MGLGLRCLQYLLVKAPELASCPFQTYSLCSHCCRLAPPPRQTTSLKSLPQGLLLGELNPSATSHVSFVLGHTETATVSLEEHGTLGLQAQKGLAVSLDLSLLPEAGRLSEMAGTDPHAELSQTHTGAGGVGGGTAPDPPHAHTQHPAPPVMRGDAKLGAGGWGTGHRANNRVQTSRFS